MSLTQGADAVEAGIQKLQTTLQTYLGEKLDGGMLNTLKEGVDKLVDGIQQLQAGYDKVDEGTSSLLAGTNTLTASNKQLSRNTSSAGFRRLPGLSPARSVPACRCRSVWPGEGVPETCWPAGRMPTSATRWAPSAPMLPSTQRKGPTR